jgi:predicted glycoside hydrolase/deacetylase ChbG (UPF0249 family)
LLEGAGPGVSEIALHPGYAAPSLRAADPFQGHREETLRVLRGEETRKALAGGRVRLISFRDLAEGGKAG